MSDETKPLLTEAISKLAQELKKENPTAYAKAEARTEKAKEYLSSAQAMVAWLTWGTEEDLSSQYTDLGLEGELRQKVSEIVCRAFRQGMFFGHCTGAASEAEAEAEAEAEKSEASIDFSDLA